MGPVAPDLIRGSTFSCSALKEQGGCRIKSGMTEEIGEPPVPH
jgi:hypothetical protein